MLLIVTVIAICFGGVILFGAPFVPTHRKQVDKILDAIKLRDTDHVVELGSGDGRVLAAASRRGSRATGYELNPILVIVSKLRLWRRRHSTRVVWADYTTAEWPEQTSVIYVFTSGPNAVRLAEVIQQRRMPRLRAVVSYGFKLPGLGPGRQQHGFYIYDYPRK